MAAFPRQFFEVKPHFCGANQESCFNLVLIFIFLPFLDFDLMKLDFKPCKLKQPLGSRAMAFIDLDKCWMPQSGPAPQVAPLA